MVEEGSKIFREIVKEVDHYIADKKSRTFHEVGRRTQSDMQKEVDRWIEKADGWIETVHRWTEKAARMIQEGERMIKEGEREIEEYGLSW